MAFLASLMINLTVATHPKKGGGTGKMSTPLELMPDWADEFKAQAAKMQSTEEMKKIMMELVKVSKMKKGKVDRSKIPPLQFNKRNNGRSRNNDSNLGNDNQGDSSGTKSNGSNIKPDQHPPGSDER